MVSRILFYPTLLSNVVINRLGLREWYTKIDDKVILGALPFRSMTNQVDSRAAIKFIIKFNNLHTESN